MCGSEVKHELEVIHESKVMQGSYSTCGSEVKHELEVIHESKVMQGSYSTCGSEVVYGSEVMHAVPANKGELFRQHLFVQILCYTYLTDLKFQ